MVILFFVCGASPQAQDREDLDYDGMFNKNSRVLTTGEWKWQNPNPQGNALRDVIFVAEESGWAVGDKGTIIHTGNGGKDWELQPSTTPLDLMSVHFVDEQTGWAAGKNGTIIKTDNGGESW